MKKIPILVLLLISTTLSQAQTGVQYSNDETGDYSSSMKSSNYTYLVWDRNDDGGGYFIDESTPNFFYWDNDDSKLNFLIDTGNMDQLNANFESLNLADNAIINDLSIGKYGSSLSGDPDPYKINTPGNSGNHDLILFGSNSNATLNLRLYDGNLKIGSESTPKAEILNNGQAYFISKVGIGTRNPTSTLTIKGTAKAEEVIVEESIGADFVFADDYTLPSLSEVEHYIKSKKHLPEIPSANEMIANGVKVGELQMKLLQKIEELTLYVIELEKRDKKKEERIQALEEKLK